MDEIHPNLPLVQVQEKLGSSGLGSTYRVFHPEYNICCYKTLTPEKKTKVETRDKKKIVLRFLSSLKMMRRIQSEYVAKVHAYDEEEGSYLIREFVPGQNLATLLSSNGKLTVAEANPILEQILYSLQTLHAFGIVHRNLKPNNVIIQENGRLVLVDISLPPTVPHFLSPEQCEGKKSDTLSDIYAVAILMYFCLVGKYPYTREHRKDIMAAHINDPLPDIASQAKDASTELIELINKMAAKNPAQRPQTCEEILQTLQEMGNLTKSAFVIPTIQAQEDIPGNIQLEVPKALEQEAAVPPVASPGSSNVESSSGPLPSYLETDSAAVPAQAEPMLAVPADLTPIETAEPLAATPVELGLSDSIPAEMVHTDEVHSTDIVTAEPTISEVTHESSYEEGIALDKVTKLKQVASDMNTRLKIVNQTLTMLEDAQGSQGLEAILFLEEMLRFITSKIGDMLRADRSVIFLVDEDRNELLPILDKDEGISLLDFRIPSNEGIMGEIIISKKASNIGFDCYDNPRSESRKKLDVRTNYRTYTMLNLPICDRQGETIAILQLLNKLQPSMEEGLPLLDRIDREGFNRNDEKLLSEFTASLRLILESSRSFYRATQRLRAASSLMSAIQTLSQSSLDLNETLHKVMDEARRLIDADRITLWLLDAERGELWANIQMADGTFREIRIPKTAGFAGKVVETQEPLVIPFDLYNHPGSQTAKNTDQKTGYRTCSLMCLPVFNLDKQLIGVTQLINKKRQGTFPPYDPKDWPKAPDCWKISFSTTDMEFIRTLNIQAGVTLQNATMFARIKQQEQMQRDILRSLANGVVSIDKSGRVITANESARRLLGLGKDERMEQRYIRDLLRLKDRDFSGLIELALGKADPAGKAKYVKDQYYPEQILLNSSGVAEHNVNLSLHCITDVQNPEQICGALVVMEDISQEKRIKSMMCRYMAQGIVDQLLQSGEIKLGGQRKDVTVMFSDIRSYTTLTEGMTAEDVVTMLNEYFEVMVNAVFEYHGTLDKYIGDALMAVFGSPMSLPDHAWYAVQCALEMRKCLVKFNEQQIAKQRKPIKIGIGVHSDQVVSGNIGCSRRMEFTAIGDGVNLASRLEGASKQYGCDIVISEETYNRCADRIYARELDFIIVKGKTKAVKIYEVIDLKTNPLPEAKQQQLTLYEQARHLYRERQFAQALSQFEEIVRLNPNDLAASLHVERCQYFIAHPPEENWDGVWKLTSK